MSLKQFFLTLCLGIALTQIGLHCAKAEPSYELVLEDEHGNTLPTYAHRSEWFAMGREGQRYNVRVHNRTARRVEAVVSVDGRDVLSGMPGNFKQQRGYIVPAYGSVLIDGFRTSLSSVAAFRFTSPSDSYSSRMGTPENVGVVGAAFFPEAAPKVIVYRRPIARPYPNRAPRDEAPASPSSVSESGSAEAEAPRAEARTRGASKSARAPAGSYADDSSNIGTQYGEATHSNVSEVSFTRARASSPDRVLTLRYDNREGLMARGILPRPRPHRDNAPSAFPVNHFAPPPPPAYWD